MILFADSEGPDQNARVRRLIWPLVSAFDRKTRFCMLWPIYLPIINSYDRSTAHYENTPIQIYRKFYHQKNENFWIKYSDIFHISAQNIDCENSLEPPRRGGSNG